MSTALPARLLLAASSLLSAASAAQPVPLWTVQFGSDGTDTGGSLLGFAGVAGAPGPTGDVYAFGRTDGDLGGPGQGLNDCFLAHYDDAGSPLWTTHLGSKADEDAGGAAPDGQGGVFVTGTTRGDLAGPSEGKYDGFVAQYESDGTQTWLKQFGTPGIDYATAAAADDSGGVYVGGQTAGSLFADHIGNEDPFVARYDHDGGLIWGVQFGSKDADRLSALARDGEGGVLVCGTTEGFLGGPLVGKQDAYLARYDGNGNRMWLTQFGGAGSENAFAVISDEAGGEFVAGSVWTLDAGSKGFIARFDAAGHEVWLDQLAVDSLVLVSSLILDGSGGVVACGLLGHGTYEVFIAGFDGSGVMDWWVPFGTPKDDGGALVDCRLGGYFMVGATAGSMGGGDEWGTDIFIARFDGKACAADCDESGDLALFDFLCFVNRFNSDNPGADCDANGALDLFDFLCFVNQFIVGC